MPDGSSSAAPVMRPGPSSAKKRRARPAGRPSGTRSGVESGVIAAAPESTSARMSAMDRSAASSRDLLRSIAHRAMAERGLLPDFAPAVVAETGAIRQAATDPSPAIRDLRDLLWCSIDNDDSRDLDQLTVTAPGRNGTVTVLVAVADVDALVAKGSAIDDHARANTTSVYTAAEIFPMLPEKLSTDLTSLGQDQARLAIVVEMTINDAGAITHSDIFRSRVINKAKLAYRSVAAWLDGKAAAPERVASVAGLDQQLQL